MRQLQPLAALWRPVRMLRLLFATVAAVGLSSVPISVVLACSCMMPGTPAETVAGSDLAFVGTVVDIAPGPADPGGFGQMVSYAFRVERASADVDGDVVEVRALGGDGGASCGFEFGAGERWFVAAQRTEAGLETGLCSGNLLIEGLSDADSERVVDALPNRPARPASSTPDAGISIPLAVLGAGGALLVIGAFAFMAFRRGESAAR